MTNDLELCVNVLADNGELPSYSRMERMGRKSGNVVLPFFKSNSANASSKYVGSTCMYKADESALRKILRPFFCGRRPLPFGGSHLRLPSGPGIRTTTGSLSALADGSPRKILRPRKRKCPFPTVSETTPMLLTIDEKKTIHA